MQAFWITSTYDAETDSLLLRARPWAEKGKYPPEANWMVHNRVENDAYGVAWGHTEEAALEAAFRILSNDVAHQISDPMGEASYYERLI